MIGVKKKREPLKQEGEAGNSGDQCLNAYRERKDLGVSRRKKGGGMGRK